MQMPFFSIRFNNRSANPKKKRPNFFHHFFGTTRISTVPIWQVRIVWSGGINLWVYSWVDLEGWMVVEGGRTGGRFRKNSPRFRCMGSSWVPEFHQNVHVVFFLFQDEIRNKWKRCWDKRAIIVVWKRYRKIFEPPRGASFQAKPSPRCT